MLEIEDHLSATDVPQTPTWPVGKSILLVVMTVLVVILVVLDTSEGTPRDWALVGYLTAMMLSTAATPPILPFLARHTRAVKFTAGGVALVSATILLVFHTRGLDVLLGVTTALFGIIVLLPVLFPRLITRFPRWFGTRTTGERV